MPYKKIYILGAGSSIGHSKGLFPSITQFFSKAKELNLNSFGNFKSVAEYAQKKFGYNFFKIKDSTNIEDFFTHIEIELEQLASPGLINIHQQLLKLIRDVLLILDEEISNTETDNEREYELLYKMLGKNDTILTFNWDLLLDNLLHRNNILNKWYVGGRTKMEADIKQYWNFIYDLSAIGENTIDGIGMIGPYPIWEPERGYFLKMHGSIDWVYCNNETCRASRKLFPIPDPRQTYFCSECHEPTDMLIIPPVLNKGYRHYPFIRRIWNVAAKELEFANEIVIWGYSLPSTDFYSSWLLRQARQAPIKKISLINPSVITKEREDINLNINFIERFTKIYNDKIKIEPNLYETFQDYFAELNIFEMYRL